MLRIKNLHRAIAAATLAPALIIGIPAIAMAAGADHTAASQHATADDGRDAILSRLLTVDTGSDRNDTSRDNRTDDQGNRGGGILSNLVTVDTGGLTSDRDRRGEQDNRGDRDGILSNLLTIGTGSSDRTEQGNRTGRGEDTGEDGILSDLVTIDTGDLTSGNDDDDDGLLGIL